MHSSTTVTDTVPAVDATTSPRSHETTLVVFDMAGTTVTDDGLVLAAFDAAARAVGAPESGPEADRIRRYVIDTMGQSKIEVFRAVFGSEEAAHTANRAFESAYDASIDGGVAEISGAAETLATLRRLGITTAFTTGFSAPTQRRILDALGWNDAADHVLSPGVGVRGRPHPDLVLAAALAAQVDDMAHIMVVGDTASDIQTGRRAGAGRVVGVLTGAHDADALWSAGATDVLDSVAQIPALLSS